MRKYLYICVSTKEQNEDRQLALKNKYHLRNSDVFIDKATGKNFDRPAYQSLKEELQKGDCLIIMSLNRLGRNKEQALEELRELKQKGVRLIVDDLPTTQIELDEKNQLIIEMINNILIEVYTTLAEEELRRTKIRQRQGIDSMPVNENGKKYSKKTGRETGRPNKQENLTTEQERYIKAWLSKSIKLSDCIKLSGLSRATLYRIKASLTSKANNSEPKIEKIKEPFDTLYDDSIDKILEPDFYVPEISELKKGDKLLEFKYRIIDETPNKFEEDEELNEYAPFFEVHTVDKSFMNSCYINGEKYDKIDNFIYLNDENYMKLLVFMEKNLIYKFTTLTDDDKNLYLLKNKNKKIYKLLETYLKQLSFKERESLYTKIVYRLENYLILDKKVAEKIKKVLKPIFLR
nr:recombinase family protein [uncultured Fusobacterium sp.]